MGRWAAACGGLIAALLLAGCHTAPQFSDVPGAAAPAPATATAPATPDTRAAGPAAAPASTIGNGDKPAVGDALTVTFIDTPVPIPPFNVTVRDDGTITLLYNKSFQAAGRLRGDLEKEIRKAYCPDYFKNLTVTISLQGQFIYVGGEVKAPNRYPYTPMTVLKAIQAAGDFTDFARKKKVKLCHADGKIVIVDCAAALQDPSRDLPVYPNDRITVPRRTYPWQ